MKLIVAGLMDQAHGHYGDFARRWLLALRKLGDDVEVVGYVTSRSFPWCEFQREVPREAFRNILVDRRGKPGGLVGRLLSLWTGVLRSLQVNLLLRESPCDAVVYLAVDPLPFCIADLVLPPPKRVRAVAIVHRVPRVPGVRGKLYSRALGRLISKSAAVLVLEPSVAKDITEHVSAAEAGKIMVVPDPRFSEADCRVDKAAWRKQPRIFAMVGMITPDKGAHVAVAAFASLRGKLPDVRLVIAGEIRDKAYKAYLNRLRGDNPAITISDSYLSREDYHRLIRSADCMLLPYTSAAGARSSGVLLDILSCDRPVIMSAIPGFTRYHTDFGLGLICAADSADSLADAVERVARLGVMESQTTAIVAAKRAHCVEYTASLLRSVLRRL